MVCADKIDSLLQRIDNIVKSLKFVLTDLKKCILYEQCLRYRKFVTSFFIVFDKLVFLIMNRGNNYTVQQVLQAATN